MFRFLPSPRWLLLLLLTPLVAMAQARTQARLLLDHATATPGSTVTAAVRLSMPAHWHTYWSNPSESGLGGQATTLDWTLPPGVTAGPIDWPVPMRLREQEDSVFAYEGTVDLLVPLTIASNVAPGALSLKATVKWLECETTCVPGKTEVNAALQIGAAPVLSSNAPEFATFRSRLPQPQRFPVDLRWTADAASKKGTLSISFKAPGGKWDFYPFAYPDLSFQASKESAPGADGVVNLVRTAQHEGKWPQSVAGLLIEVDDAGKPKAAYRLGDVSPAVPASGTNPATAVPSPSPAAEKETPFLLILAGAFIGGLILNIMPCVLPVIALKILGFVRQGQETPGRVRALGLMYGAGVLASFAAIAGLMIALSFANRAVHQGVLFQSSTFLVLMTLLVVLISMNLFGVFEVTLDTAVATAGSAAHREGLGGAFFNGVLATVLATPCSAPYLGASIGFALRPGQNPMITLVMYLAAGLGLALPYVVLCFQPRWLKLLPKPGNWMIRFKKFMGFPMLGTAVWLFMLLASHYDKDQMLWIGLFMVVMALAAWVFGEFIQGGTERQKLSWALVALLVAGGYGWLLESKAEWRAAPVAAATSSSGEAPLAPGRHKLPWRVWSPEAVEKARATGRPVFVDFTADYCTTCNFNKAYAIEVPAVIEQFKSLNTHLFLADFSRDDPRIAALLRTHQRAGVPLVLVYSVNPAEAPRVLPERLTQEIVLEALNWANTRR